MIVRTQHIMLTCPTSAGRCALVTPPLTTSTVSLANPVKHAVPSPIHSFPDRSRPVMPCPTFLLPPHHHRIVLSVSSHLISPSIGPVVPSLPFLLPLLASLHHLLKKSQCRVSRTLPSPPLLFSLCLSLHPIHNTFKRPFPSLPPSFFTTATATVRSCLPSSSALPVPPPYLSHK